VLELQIALKTTSFHDERGVLDEHFDSRAHIVFILEYANIA
jgi:hypothetical protein